MRPSAVGIAVGEQRLAGRDGTRTQDVPGNVEREYGSGIGVVERERDGGIGRDVGLSEEAGALARCVGADDAKQLAVTARECAQELRVRGALHQACTV